MRNKKLGVAKRELAFWCNWLWKILRLCDMSSLLFRTLGMTGSNVAQCI